MKINKGYQKALWHRLFILGGVAFVASALILMVLTWSSLASAQINRLPGSSLHTKNSAQESIHVEFILQGGNLVTATTAAVEFANLLSQETGFSVTASIHPCETIVVEHLGSGQADLAPLSPVAYVFGHEDYGIEARLVNGRFGQFYFRSQFNVQATSGYTDIWSLQGTRFAAPHPDSRSGYMVPYLHISETTGMTPTTFFSEVTFVGSHDQVIREVYTGTADCGTTYEDARDAVAGEYPDVYTVVNVLTYTQGIPYHETWAFRSGLDEMDVQTLSNGIIAVAGTPAGEKALETIFGYAPSPGIGATQDSAYDIWRDLVAVFSLQMTDVCYQVNLPGILKD